MSDTVENGVYLRDGKPLYTLPGDNERAVTAFARNETAKVAQDDTASDDAVVVKAQALFEADKAKTNYTKVWADAPEGMRAHFIRLASA